ncbi:hypothetical protein MNBD_GAMMA11-2606 [hydrothermal vent metagenome]|uniref:Uncharacterized protein n=1 Tax=hydrothermal vent metagenome TaxID=652676 RepID=A0A3B0XDN6_9ZZZZ
MSIDKEQLQKDKAQLNALFEAGRGGKADAALIKQLRKQFYEIREASVALINSQEGATARYEYIEFCLGYIASYIINKEGSAYINPENDIFSYCSGTICNDDFPAQLEEKILAAIQGKKLDNTYSIQLLARKLKDKEHYTRATGYYQAIKDRLSNPDAWNDWAQCYSAQEEYAMAADTIENGLKHYSDSQLLNCNYAFYLARNKQQSKALEVLDGFVKRVEIKKYADDHFYVYAINYKTILYREYKMALHELIEYSRLSATGGWNREAVMKEVEKIRPIVEAMTYG